MTQRLTAYIRGANLERRTLDMTVPLLTYIEPKLGFRQSENKYGVSLYLEHGREVCESWRNVGSSVAAGKVWVLFGPLLLKSPQSGLCAICTPIYGFKG